MEENRRVGIGTQHGRKLNYLCDVTSWQPVWSGSLVDLQRQEFGAITHNFGFHSAIQELPSGEIFYIDEGQGPPIMLLHGAPSTSIGFMRVIQSLRRDFRVIAPDLPGFGQSRASPKFVPSLQGYATSVEELCNALHLCDLTMYLNDSSACIGLGAASNLRSRIRSLVVADTVPIPLTGRAWPVRLILRYVLGSTMMRWINRKLNLLPWLVVTVAPYLQPFSKDQRTALLAQFDTLEKRDRVLDLFEAMGTDMEFMQDTALAVKKTLAKIPVLLLYGQFDPMRFVGAIARFQRLFHHTTVRIIPMEEHFPIFGSGQKVAEVVKVWLSEQYIST